MTAPHDVSGVHTVIGVDAGSVNLRAADHLIHHLADGLGLPAGAVACTHLIRTGDRPRTAVSLAFPDPGAAWAAWGRLAVLLAADAERARGAGPGAAPGAELGAEAGAALGEQVYGPAPAAHAAALAAAEHTRKDAGRAVRYPGAELLTGTLTVADLLARSAIDHVVMVGAPSGEGPDPATPVLTRDHVRPEWRGGALVLPLTPAPGGLLAPFEVPNPTPCCADHP